MYSRPKCVYVLVRAFYRNQTDPRMGTQQMIIIHPYIYTFTQKQQPIIASTMSILARSSLRTARVAAPAARSQVRALHVDNVVGK